MHALALEYGVGHLEQWLDHVVTHFSWLEAGMAGGAADAAETNQPRRRAMSLVGAIPTALFFVAMATSLVRLFYTEWLFFLAMGAFYSPVWIGSVIGDNLGSTVPAVIGMSIELFLLALLLLFAAARWWVHRTVASALALTHRAGGRERSDRDRAGGFLGGALLGFLSWLPTLLITRR
jgi:hypothetical protein